VILSHYCQVIKKISCQQDSPRPSSELKKEPSIGKIGGDLSLKGSVEVSKPKLEYKMSRRTLGIAFMLFFFFFFEPRRYFSA
jgi:hypothetical protein